MIKFKSRVLNRFIFAKQQYDISLLNGESIPLGYYGTLEIKDTDQVNENLMFTNDYFAPGCTIYQCGAVPGTEKIKCLFKVDDTFEWT